MSPFVRHVDWVLTLVNALPESFSSKCIPGTIFASPNTICNANSLTEWGGIRRMKNDILDHLRSIEESRSTEKWMHYTPQHPSKAPSIREKTTAQLAQDGQILAQGGTLTTSWAISLATFHLLNRPETLRKLRDELFEAIPDPYDTVPLSKLESLPYLRGVVKEALRLGVASSRLTSVAPDETLICHDRETDKKWRLPPGSVVGMTPYKTVMDESIFYDAQGFHPERWVKDGERLEKYLTIFCTGPKVSLGMALAHSELYLMLAKLFRQWGSGGVVYGSDEGDYRPGDLGSLSIYETRVRDCDIDADYFMPIPYKVCPQ